MEKKTIFAMTDGITETAVTAKPNTVNSSQPGKSNSVGTTSAAVTTQQNTTAKTSTASASTPVSTQSAGSVSTQNNGTANATAAFTQEELNNLYTQNNIDPSSANEYSHLGSWTKDQEEALAHGGTGESQKYFTGEEGWYYYDGTPRTEYADDADATFMSDADYQLTTANKNEWHRLDILKKNAVASGQTELVAQIQAQQDALHLENERIRATYGYSGGDNGSMFYQINTDSDFDHGYTVETGSGGAAGGNIDGTAGVTQPSYVQTQKMDELREMLKTWKDTAEKQVGSQIDDAVTNAVADLERALEDAQPQFKGQMESVDRDAMQALDNSALYAQLRGDRGGIGREQYNAIQNTAARNHLSVQQAQTRLATDTARQIEDLRAQGEFQKANAALELAQNYLSQLVSLEKWAAELSLSEREFQDSVDQWKAEYALDQQKLQINDNQWQQELTAAQNKSLAAMGEALLRAGVTPTAEQLAAMGMTAEQADSYLILRQLELAR